MDEVYRRTESERSLNFDYNRTVLANHMRFMHRNTPEVACFYQNVYNSVLEIDGKKSKWFMEDRAMVAIEANLKSRLDLSRALAFDMLKKKSAARPCEFQNTHFDRALLKSSLSQFRYYCPVTWKNTKMLVKCTNKHELCVLYENAFFYFRGEAEKNMFLSNPLRFVNNVIFSSDKGIPLRIKPHKAAEIIA